MSDIDYKKLDKLLEFVRGKDKLRGAPVRSPDYESSLDTGKMIVKADKPVPEPKTVIKNATDHIDTKSAQPLLGGAEHAAKISALRGLKKKALGIIPFAGAAAGLMSGDPAMAAEEAAGDLPVVGQAYEALKSDDAGESPEEEAQMLAEDRARKDYNKSPARLNKLQAMMGNRSPAIDQGLELDPNSVVRESEVQNGRIPMSPERIKALTVGRPKIREEGEDVPEADVAPTDPQEQRNARFLKLFKGQLKNRE